MRFMRRRKRGSEMSWTDNTLHIYGQGFQHEPVGISGSHAALRELVDAINKALIYGDCESEAFYVNDGEGYTIAITVVPEEDLDQLRVPYITEPK
jgi:hypothetical protein